MQRKFLTKEQLLEVWERKDNIDAIKKYAKEIGFSNSSLYQARGYLKKFVSGERALGVNSPMAYTKAVKQIKKSMKQGGVYEEQETQHISESKLENLEHAFSKLQEAVVEFVTEEVEKRSHEQIAQKEKELLEQKEKYEQELLRLQTIITQAKNSSITGLIKRKWNSL